MYLKITEPISSMGNALKEAAGKQDVDRILRNMRTLSETEKQTLQRFVKQYESKLKKVPGAKFSSEDIVTAGISKKLIPTLSLLLALVGTGAASAKELADTTKPLENSVMESLEKADIPQLAVKLAPIQQQLEQEEAGAFKVDPSIGPAKAPAKAPTAPSKMAPKAPSFTA